MLIEAGKTYLNRDGEKVRINRRQTYEPNPKRPFEDEFGCLYYPDGRLFSDAPTWRSDLVREYAPTILCADGTTTTLTKIEGDVLAAKTRYGERDLAFTWVTVESLLNKIRELEGIQ